MSESRDFGVDQGGISAQFGRKESRVLCSTPTELSSNSIQAGHRAIIYETISEQDERNTTIPDGFQDTREAPERELKKWDGDSTNKE